MATKNKPRKPQNVLVTESTRQTHTERECRVSENNAAAVKRYRKSTHPNTTSGSSPCVWGKRGHMKRYATVCYGCNLILIYRTAIPRNLGSTNLSTSPRIGPRSSPLSSF